ncbi:hypothetical protein [Streptomyces sp. NPDC001978]|uniref:hypothetical protein n=1 Tax=Streptomyces sp. NPDC001978 TaxID=3364627 RepID=UPI00369E1D1E
MTSVALHGQTVGQGAVATDRRLSGKPRPDGDFLEASCDFGAGTPGGGGIRGCLVRV